ncbi:MAG: DUF1684 domain-containing protein [Bacteroidota bacterium]|jgi:uncharacterized protein (DUF1684 family)
MPVFFRFTSLVICCLFWQASTCQTVSYETSIEQWYKKRIEDLKAPDGWVNLTGLFWLEKGINRMGRKEGHAIVVPHPDMPALAGYFDVTENEVTWVTEPGCNILYDQKPVSTLIVYSRAQTNQPLLALGSLRFNIIIRGDKIGIRLRDLKSPALEQFKAPKRFATNPQWKLRATFEATPTNSIAIQNVLGQINRETSPGKLVFNYRKNTYRLDVLDEGDHWFVLFADGTSGKSTYPTGRFLYVPKVNNPGEVYIDFNQAFNPPCAFTSFATCPIPPPQNRLPFAVTAGEQYDTHVPERK